MFTLDEKYISKLVSSPQTFIRGKKYYSEGKVKKLEVERISEDQIYINAIVQGSYGYRYDAEIIMDEDGVKTTDCECDAFYNYEGACKHVVAALLEYKKRVNMNRDKYSYADDNLVQLIQHDEEDDYQDSQSSDAIVKFLTNRILNKNGNVKEAKTILNMEVCYELMATRYGEMMRALSLKIGDNRLYVVKDMREFINDYFYQASQLYFGKCFTYDPKEHEFCDEDKKIMDLLLEVNEINNSIAMMSGYGNAAKMLDRKYAYITRNQAERFFDIVHNRKITIKINDIVHENINVIEGDMPLQFELMQNRNKISLYQSGTEQRPIPLDCSSERYFLYNESAYKVSNEQKEIYLPFYNKLYTSKNGCIEFSKAEKENILSYLVPSLEKISKEVKVAPKITEGISKEELKNEVYLDKEDDKVIAKINFKYGDEIINYFEENSSRNATLLRDVIGEINLISVFEAYSFIKGKDAYELENEEAIVKFLSSGVDKLQEISEVYYSDAFKNMKIYKSSSYKTSIGVNKENLLEFSFSIDGIDQSDLKGILTSMRQSKRYHKLKKGGFVDLQSDELTQLTKMIEYLDIKDDQLSKGPVVLQRYNSLYIENRLKDIKDIQIKRNRQFKDLISNVSQVSDNDFDVPSHLENTMRYYQKTGFKWYKTLSQYGFGGILADEMGLGKTLQTIAFMESEYAESTNSQKPCLVIAPSSLVYNWESEIDKFSSGLTTLVIAGGKSEREELFDKIKEHQVIITSYPLIRRDIDVYKDIDFKYCFLDEAQNIKNPNSMNANSVKEIKAEGRFVVTGTPIENSLVELWSLFDFIMPGYLYTRSKFGKKFENPIYRDKSEDVLKELYAKISPFILRRRKSEVIKELPPKIEHKVIVEMGEEQKKLYLAYLKAAKGEIDEVINAEGFGKGKLKILAVLTRLRQICCDPTTFLQYYEGESAKLLALSEMLDDIISDGHKVLIFSQFTTVLKHIGEMLKTKKVDFLYLDGSTKVEDRMGMVQNFNQGETKVFLISLKAGGTGLNLTGADTVIHFDPWWNPAVEDQATDRAHRIGQKNTVEVIKLITKGTIEEKICKLQETKKEIINDVIKDGEKLITSMDEEDIKALLD